MVLRGKLCVFGEIMSVWGIYGCLEKLQMFKETLGVLGKLWVFWGAMCV